MVQLNARIMARMIDSRHDLYASSGSEHDGDRGTETRSLSDLVECFLEESWRDESVVEDEDHEAGRVRTELTQRADSIACEEMTRILSDKEEDGYRNLLVSQVHQALHELSFGYGSVQTVPFYEQQTLVLRGVMTRLRSLGHNAAVCKTKWDTSKSGGLVSGSHEFIDVLTTTTYSTQMRYIIELDFASKFEVARPTESYERLVRLLPESAIVATEDEIKRIVKLMSDEAKKSLKSRELHLPPWRKNRYMQMKWFGPYKRTTNALPGGARSGLSVGSGDDGRLKVECRAVGFEPVFDEVKGLYFVSTR